jgi:hypothetical protein
MVKRTESRLGRKLPLGYFAKMCEHNGGQIVTGSDSWDVFPIFDDSDKKRRKRTCNDIVRETRVAREWSGFPEGALAIGANGGGDLLVLLSDWTSDRYADAVYWLDHETGQVSLLADCFSDLKDED